MMIEADYSESRHLIMFVNKHITICSPTVASCGQSEFVTRELKTELLRVGQLTPV